MHHGSLLGCNSCYLLLRICITPIGGLRIGNTVAHVPSSDHTEPRYHIRWAWQLRRPLLVICLLKYLLRRWRSWLGLDRCRLAWANLLDLCLSGFRMLVPSDLVRYHSLHFNLGLWRLRDRSSLNLLLERRSLSICNLLGLPVRHLLECRLWLCHERL